MPNRACVRHERGAERPSAPGSLWDAGTRTPSKTSSLVSDARRLILRFTGFAVRPGVPAGTMNPMIPVSPLAHTSTKSAMLP